MATFVSANFDTFIKRVLKLALTEKALMLEESQMAQLLDLRIVYRMFARCVRIEPTHFSTEAVFEMLIRDSSPPWSSC